MTIRSEKEIREYIEKVKYLLESIPSDYGEEKLHALLWVVGDRLLF
jgi:hypothetical protein